jgi:hypothetical protein
MSTPCANFFPEMEFNGSDSIDVNTTGDGSCADPLVVNVDAVLSADPGNALEERVDGLYAAPEILCYQHQFDFDQTPALTASPYTTCRTWHTVKAGATVAFLPPFLHKPATGTSLIVRIYNISGTILSTCTIAANSSTGTWSTPTWTNGVSNTQIAAVVTQVGSTFGGCGLSVPIQVCEPFSAYADPGEFYDNLDPTQLCEIIASNCNSTMVEVSPGTFRHTSNDGVETDLVLNGFSGADVSPLTENSITYSNGAYSARVYSVRAHKALPNINIDGTAIHAVTGGSTTVLNQNLGYLTLTNPSQTRPMKVALSISQPSWRYVMSAGHPHYGKSGGTATAINEVFRIEARVNNGTWVSIHAQNIIGTGSVSVDPLDWQFYEENLLHNIPMSFDVTASSTYTLDLRIVLQRLSATRPIGSPDGLGYSYARVTYPPISAIGIVA